MPVGLQNQGNTCYMNSALQLITNSSYLRDAILRQDNQYASALKKIIIAKSSIIPREIKTLMGLKYSRFHGYQQQDSHEFISLCLGMLEDEEGVKNKYYEEVNYDCPMQEGYEKYRDYCLKRQTSEMQELLRYYKVLDTQCENCGTIGYSFHEDESIILKIKQASQAGKDKSQGYISSFTLFFGGSSGEPIDMNTLLESYFAIETTDRICKKCNQCKLSTQLKLWTLPKQLLIVFARFTGKFTKLNNKINYDQIVSLNKYFHNDSPYKEQEQFKLEAVSLHSGSTSGGHYTAFVIDDENSMYDCNDSCVSETTSVINDPRAYVLSYAMLENSNIVETQEE
ncbi:Ubiquitin carboxyl-terminal hydrolase family protein [Spironucleus salmonicida]|uniref:Ubiquitin carboxyl-terminal hydrolase family protein n=1 Tax=Spironucleus salmonicida TaxID=348837 RepID=V6LHG1_9EUKA|nr:Ubiquitin carboxyl-terminal hydrolase family protein [Spironucleus salmonicida]|eukprot:EST43728.1 Ubiquitin carboxyl-terminal hydrolase family protein [Spironucleus salmonicida]